MPILETRAEIQKYFCYFFGSNENFNICFRDWLTFSTFVELSSWRIVWPNFPFVLNHSNFRRSFLFLFSVIYSGSNHDIFPLLCHLCHDHKFSEACSSMCTWCRLGFDFQILHLVWNTTWFWQKWHIHNWGSCQNETSLRVKNHVKSRKTFVLSLVSLWQLPQF